MPVTLDIPPHILERADKVAASNGISLDALVARMLERLSPASILQNETPNNASSIFGRLRGTVLYMADDFNAPLEDFREYMQ